AGARVVSMSYVGGFVNEEDVADYVYALSHGVIMVSARDNQDLPGADDLVGEPTKNNYFPGMVTVNAVHKDGNLAVLSDTKDGNVSILSPAVGTATYVDTSDREITKGGGTSTAAAVLNGYLALVMSKWPDATGNQILQSLVRNTKGNDSGEAQLDAEHKRGFGQVDLTKLLATDPTQYPDINPLLEQVMQRSEAHVETQGMYQDHRAWEDYTWSNTDKFPYEIRVLKNSDLVGKEYERQKAAWAKVEACRTDGGADCMQYSATATAAKTDAGTGSSDTSASASSSSSKSHAVPVAAWVAIGAGALLLLTAIIVLVVVLVRRRKRTAVVSGFGVAGPPGWQ
ncbi:S8/S53 family peptidase, partial [Bifidobacterium cuniculi]